MKLKILAVSDTHDEFEKFAPASMPDADFCLMAGDLTNFGKRQPGELGRAHGWLLGMARKYGYVYYIPGNHDIGMSDEFQTPIFPHLDRLQTERILGMLNKTVTHSLGNLSIHGVSCSPCYNAPRLALTWDYMTVDQDAEHRAYAFPKVDIVLSHCPPLGILDCGGARVWTESEGVGPAENLGSIALRDYIDRYQPLLVVCGHIHEAAGMQMVGKTAVYNVARKWELIELEIPAPEPPLDHSMVIDELDDGSPLTAGALRSAIDHQRERRAALVARIRDE